jgi:hypothetical protein
MWDKTVGINFVYYSGITLSHYSIPTAANGIIWRDARFLSFFLFFLSLTLPVALAVR